MIRLVDDAFKGYAELHSTAVYCLTNTIKTNLEIYFEEDYRNVSVKELYKKVKLDKALSLFPNKLLWELQRLDIQIEVFIPKKLAQLMLLLDQIEEENPDIFLEYILVKMILHHTVLDYHYSSYAVQTKIPELKQLLHTYAIEESELDDTDDCDEFVQNHLLLLTQFTHLLGVEETDKPDDYCLLIWDWDYLFFDEQGFEQTFKKFAYGMIGQMRGYGADYMESIFTKIQEPLPFALQR